MVSLIMVHSLLSASGVQDTLGVPAAGSVRVEQGQVMVETAGKITVAGPDGVPKDALWHLGSNTKALTALLAARLMESKRLDLSAKVFSILGIEAPNWKHLTVRHLMDQDGGVPDLTYVGGPSWWTDRRPAREQRRDYAQKLAQLQPKSQTFRYSNANYVLLGAVCEALGNDSWEKLVSKEVLAPLGITRFAVGPVPAGSPQPHVQTKEGFVIPPQGMARDNAPAIAPAGGLSLTLEGYGRWMQAVMERDRKLLREESWSRLFAVKPGTQYVAGWLVVWQDGRPRQITHFGSNTLHTFGCWIDLTRKRAAALGVNAFSDRIQEELNRRLSAWMLLP